MSRMSSLNCHATHLRWRLLAFLCFVAEIIPESTACPKSCACYIPTEVHCTFRYLTAVPGDIQLGVEKMNLGYNSLTLLKQNDFSGLSRLEVLMLHSNIIHQMEDKTFSDLQCLQSLKMSYNKVKEINKDTFFGLRNLTKLHIDHNRIEFIHPEAFHGLNALQLIHLEGNLLQQLHPDTFVTTRYSQIFKTSSVTSIHLSDNALSRLPSNIFSHCTQLESVYLHGNPWSCDCRIAGLVEWITKNTGVLKCKRERRYARGLLCPVCEFPVASKGRSIAPLPHTSLSCSKPWILPHLKQKNITLDEGDYTAISPGDFIAPLGSLEMKVTDHFQNDASVACTVRRPSVMENMTVINEEEVTILSATVATSLVCNIDYEQIQQLWRILATYSDSPMRLERGLMLTKTPEMTFKYTQKRPEEGDDEVFTNIEAEIKANPGWLLQDEITLQLDRTTTTFTTLHIKYLSTVHLREESKVQRKDRYGWVMIKKDNLTKTEHTVLIGGVTDLNCQIHGNPKPSTEWILPDGSKVRAPYNSEDHRIVITDTGRLTVRVADSSDTGLYHCIATNYLEADVLTFRITVLSPDVEEGEVNGGRLSQKLDDNLVLDCSSHGNPEASVQWILPDHTVLEKSHGNRKLHQNGTLKVQGLTQRDRGFYRCLATNYMGVDLLAYQISIISDGSKQDKLSEPKRHDGEFDSKYEEIDESASNKIPYGQESRTITSDRPYPRRRPSPERIASSTVQRRRGPMSNKRTGGVRRTFDKTLRKVDPEKWAEIMTKAQRGRKTDDEDKKGQETKIESLRKSISGLSGDGYEGSGDSLSEVNVIIPSTIGPATESAYVMSNTHSQTEAVPIASPSTDITTRSSFTESNTITSLNPKHHQTFPPNDFYTTEGHTSRPPNLPIMLKMKLTDSANEMPVTFSGDDEETATGVMTLLMTQYPNVTSIMEVTSPRIEPVVHTSSDSNSHTTFTAVTTTEQGADEISFHATQKITSPYIPAGSTIISQQQIHIIPANRHQLGRKRYFPGRRRIIRPNRITDIHAYLNKVKKPPVSHKVNATMPYLIEVTTDCKCHDPIKNVTHTTSDTQNIMKTSGSSLHGTEESVTTALKTSKVTTATWPTMTQASTPQTLLKIYSMKPPTTESADKTGYSGFITSVETPEHESGELRKSTTQTNELPVTSKGTTTPSKVIRGKIPWQKLFGNKGQKDVLNRLWKPVKSTITTQITTTSSTVRSTELQFTTESFVPPVTKPLKPTKKKVLTQSPEVSYEGSGSSSAPETESVSKLMLLPPTDPPLRFTKKTALSQTTTINPNIASRSQTGTTKATPNTKTLAFPPTVQPSTVKKMYEASSSSFVPVSGSGGSSKGYVYRHKWSRRPNGGLRRNGFRRRRPSKSNITSTSRATVSTPARTTPTNNVTTSVTRFPTTSANRYKTVLKEAEKYTTASKVLYSGDETTSDNDDWKITPTLERPASHSKHYTPTTKPKIRTTIYPTTTIKITTTPMPDSKSQIQTTSSRSSSRINTNTIRMHTDTKLSKGQGTQYRTQKPSTTKARPTTFPQRVNKSADGKSFESNQHGDIYDENDMQETITLDTSTILSAEQDYTNTPAPAETSDSSVSTGYGSLNGYHTTTFSMLMSESSTKDEASKPRIVGGNAASYTVLSDSDAYLPCESSGHPKPTISWKRFSSNTGSTLTIISKMGKFEVFKNGTLLIQNANIKDRGQYLCLAENSVGSDKLLVTLSVVAYPSRILEPKVRDINSQTGSTIEMKCKAEGRPTPLVSWILANRTQVRGYSSNQGRVTVTPDGTLVIRQVSVYDRGQYKCIASNPAGVDTATVRLQVVAAPPGILEDKRQHVTVKAGQSLKLPCTAQGSPQPTVHWVLFDGTLIRPLQDLRRDVSVLANGTLLMRSPQTSEGGTYECIATSSTGSERRVVTVSVEQAEAPPRIVEASQRWTELSYGQRLLLNCSAEGEPKPSIIWRLPSKALVDQWHRMGNRIQVLDNGTLIVHPLSEKDTGDYLCVARNKIGDDLQLMKVSVFMKPAKIETKLFSKKQVPYGNDLKVDCRASGVPMPEISWGLPDGTVVNSALQADDSGSRVRRYVLFDNGTLYINKVDVTEQGDYTCIAENTLGKDEMHVHITVVTAAPRIRQPSHTYAKVKPGGTVRFDCDALGEPKPKVLWKLPSNDIIAASNDRYLMHVNGSLEIHSIKLFDVGEYVCMARNAAGDESKVYNLDIDGNPPIINGYHKNRTVVKEAAAKYSRKLIDCNAQGNPTPQITWIMPDNIFITAPYFGSRINVHQNGTLEIKNVRPTDAAEFICMARNDGGEAVMAVQLEVTNMLRRPIFKSPFNERVVTRMGKTTVLNCSADGQPVPEISWMLPNGSRVTGSLNEAHQQLGNNGIFTIYKPTKEDSGKYRCSAKNTVGYIEKIIILDVGQQPYILTRPKGIIRSMSGDPLFLHCLADGSPRPQIHWTLPGGHVLSRPQVNGRYQLVNNGTLIVRDTSLHDRGNYLCKAKNDIGEATMAVPVLIIAYPPRITSGPPRNIQAIAGTAIQISCDATGMPKPDIIWELPNRSMLSPAGKGHSTSSKLLHQHGTLIIQRPNTSHSGTYKCIAKNHMGVDSRVTYIHVL
ncbi:immunoglobulin superfamily member 10 [Paramormyrops kingsleyae]|uniref:immunoglobulin superfamily member 10 n=1 Tax=Paramormyrops kingsleyae TaxID=1676925 RepID=UPI003B977DB4